MGIGSGKKEKDDAAGSVGGPPPRVLLNGESTAFIPIADRGLAYGDGLFETIGVSASRPELWDRHMARLETGCARLKFPPPDLESLAREAEKLCNGARLCDGQERGILKIILTRGGGGRGYRLPDPPAPSRILSFHPRPDYPDSYAREGVAVRLCDLRLSAQPALAGLKHLNRLENVLARAEWTEEGIFEGLLRDEDGHIIEGVMSNVFVVRQGALATPGLSRCGSGPPGPGRRCRRSNSPGPGWGYPPAVCAHPA